MLGKTEEQAKGKKCYELIGRGKPCPACATDRAVKSKKAESVERYFPELDKYLYCRSSPVLDDEGNVVKVIEHLHDITRRKKTEQALRESEERFRDIAEASGEYIWELDGEFRHVYISDRVSEVSKIPKEEILGRTPFEFMVTEDAERVKNLFRSCIEKGKRRETVECRFSQPDGRVIWMEVNAVIVFDGKGKISGFRGTSRDITEHKKQEKVLIQKKERYQSAINLQEEMICCSKPDTTILYVNPTYAKALNRDYKDLIGRKFLEFAPPEEQARILEHLGTLNKDNPSATHENEILLHDGGRAWYEWTNYAIFSDDGEVVEYLSVGMDITGRKLMEEKLKEYTSKIREQELSLEQKQSAFKEMMEYIDTAKAEMKEEIASNINEFVLPALDKLKLRGESSKYIDIIRDFLTKELASDFGRQVTNRNNNLTPQEVQICGMFREGLSTKEAANLLNISFRTVEKHRQNIRSKLGISNEHINLTTYLKNL